MDDLQQEDITLAVSNTSTKVRLTRFGKPIRDIRRIELHGWKATGATNDPNATTGVYQNDMLYLNVDGLGQSQEVPKGHDISNANPNAHLAKTIYTLNLPKEIFSTADLPLTAHGEVGEQLQSPLIISDYPAGDGVVEYFAPELRRNSGTIPAISLAAYTYTNLYLNLRFYFENSKRP
jgi:hypothetical protein